MKQKDKSELPTEMRFLRRVKDLIRRDLNRNEDIREDPDIYEVNDKILELKKS